MQDSISLCSIFKWCFIRSIPNRYYLIRGISKSRCNFTDFRFTLWLFLWWGWSSSSFFQHTLCISSLFIICFLWLSSFISFWFWFWFWCFIRYNLYFTISLFLWLRFSGFNNIFIDNFVDNLIFNTIFIFIGYFRWWSFTNFIFMYYFFMDFMDYFSWFMDYFSFSSCWFVDYFGFNRSWFVDYFGFNLSWFVDYFMDYFFMDYFSWFVDYLGNYFSRFVDNFSFYFSWFVDYFSLYFIWHVDYFLNYFSWSVDYFGFSRSWYMDDLYFRFSILIMNFGHCAWFVNNLIFYILCISLWSTHHRKSTHKVSTSSTTFHGPRSSCSCSGCSVF